MELNFNSILAICILANIIIAHLVQNAMGQECGIEILTSVMAQQKWKSAILVGQEQHNGELDNIS